MAHLDLYTQSGEKKGKVEVNDMIFSVEGVNHTLIHEALIRQEANARKNIAFTKTRSDVRGGGRKPRPQKGTGGARQGSTRNIHMKGGGVAFGPRADRNYTKMMPKKQRRKALFSALTLKCQDGEIAALEKYEAKEVKTKLFAEMLSRLPFSKTVLVVVPEKENVISLSSRNIPHVKVIMAQNLNIKDVLSYKNVLFLKEALAKIEEVFIETVKKA